MNCFCVPDDNLGDCVVSAPGIFSFFLRGNLIRFRGSLCSRSSALWLMNFVLWSVRHNHFSFTGEPPVTSRSFHSRSVTPGSPVAPSPARDGLRGLHQSLSGSILRVRIGSIDYIQYLQPPVPGNAAGPLNILRVGGGGYGGTRGRTRPQAGEAGGSPIKKRV